WRAVAGTKWLRAAPQRASGCFSLAARKGQHVQSARPAWRPPLITAAEQEPRRNEPGGDHSPSKHFNFAVSTGNANILDAAWLGTCSRASFPYRRFCCDYNSGATSPGVAYPLRFAAIFNFPGTMREGNFYRHP